MKIKGVKIDYGGLKPVFAAALALGAPIFLGGVYSGMRLTKIYNERVEEAKRAYENAKDEAMVIGISAKSELSKCLDNLNSIEYSSACINQPWQDDNLRGIEGIESIVKSATDSAKPIAEKAKSIIDKEKDSDGDRVPDYEDNCKWVYNPQQSDIVDREACDTSPYTAEGEKEINEDSISDEK